MSRELVKQINRIGEAFHLSTKTSNEMITAAGNEIVSLRERVEFLEAKGSAIGKPGSPSQLHAHKQFETDHGPIFEIPSNVKMADVIPAGERPPVSLERWLGAIVAGEKCGDRGDREALQFAREQKQLVTTTSGTLIPIEYQSQWIDLIRAQQVLNAAGQTTVVMTGKTQQHSAVATDPAASWHTEAGTINVGNPTFVSRSLTAQTLVCRCQASVEIAQDSPDFGAQLAAVMTRAMAVELDRVGLVGSGAAPEPRGIANTSGRGSISAVGSVSDFTPILRGVKTLLAANIPLDIATANVLLSPYAWYTFEALVTGIASDKSQLRRPASLANTNFLVTTNSLDSENSPQTSTLILGDFRDLVLGVRAEASVEILKLATYGTNLLLEFVGYLRGDYLVRRPASFVTIEGVSVAS